MNRVDYFWQQARHLHEVAAGHVRIDVAPEHFGPPGSISAVVVARAYGEEFGLRVVYNFDRYQNFTCGPVEMIARELGKACRDLADAIEKRGRFVRWNPADFPF